MEHFRANLAAKKRCQHGSKRDTAALTAIGQRIAPTPRQGYASPGCIRPQPALDPATGLVPTSASKHFSGLKNGRRQISAEMGRHQQRRWDGSGDLFLSLVLRAYLCRFWGLEPAGLAAGGLRGNSSARQAQRGSWRTGRRATPGVGVLRSCRTVRSLHVASLAPPPDRFVISPELARRPM